MKVGSLFSGYGGLDLAVCGELAWYSEIEPAACTVMEAHHPGVPNIGDITKVDWSEVEAVDVITGGYPCQPFSNAGKRKGTNDERHLWPYVRDALSAIRPQAAVLENVRGHLTLGFDVVLADLADLGWSARWGVVRAADAGAPHGRDRLFIVANSQGTTWRTAQSNDLAATVGRAAELGERTGTYSWGTYAQAIARWEGITGRAAPTAWFGYRINPEFVEWMMGLPEGWVTGHGLSASQELKMLGNGVVPQQARLALQLLGGMA